MKNKLPKIDEINNSIFECVESLKKLNQLMVDKANELVQFVVKRNEILKNNDFINE